jgi:hypothetical protein
MIASAALMLVIPLGTASFAWDIHAKPPVWSDAIIHRIHLSVLTQIRTLSEHDRLP